MYVGSLASPRKTDGCRRRRRVLTQTLFGLPLVGTERVNKPKTAAVHLVGVFMG